MKKILLTLLLSVFFIQGVNAETVKTYLIKDGVDQVDFTGGHTFLLVDANGPIKETQNSGYISLAVKRWGRAEFLFNNMFDLSKYDTIFIDYEFPAKWSGDLATAELTLKETTDFSTSLINGGQPTPRTTASLDISSLTINDYIYINVLNLADVDSYQNYPINIYNIWLESNLIEEPIIPDTTLDSFYTLYLDKLKILANYSVENKYFLSAISIILLFCLLELILKLFNKGGYRR